MSNIKVLRINNFKGIGGEVEFHLKPITLFFGQNSSGKSTVLHALNYLNDIFNLHAINADGTSLGLGSIDLGGFSQFVHQHDLNRSIGFGLDIDCTDIDLIETNAALSYREIFEIRQTDNDFRSMYDLSEVTSEIESLSIDLVVSWSESNKHPYVSKLDVKSNGEHFAGIICSSDCRRIEITKLNLSHQLLGANEIDAVGIYSLFEEVVESWCLDGNGSSLIGIANAKDALPEFNKPLKLAEIWAGDDWVENDGKAAFRGLLSTLILGPLEVAADELDQLRYLGPIREVPGREYKPRKGEGYNWANGLAAWDALFHEPRALLDAVNEWMHSEDLGVASLMTGYTVKIAEYKQLEVASRLMGLLQTQSIDEHRDEIGLLIDELAIDKHIVLRDERRDIDVFPGDVGIGISQLLPVIVCALSKQVKMLSIEQPELHIHPGLQVALGDLLIHAAMDLDKTFLIETHSEHLMLRLLRRIRETSENDSITPIQGALRPDDINVVYVDCVEGETRLIPMRVDEEGDFLDRWPNGFFGERAEELF